MKRTADDTDEERRTRRRPQEGGGGVKRTAEDTYEERRMKRRPQEEAPRKRPAARAVEVTATPAASTVAADEEESGPEVKRRRETDEEAWADMEEILGLLGEGSAHVSEVFSPPRVTKEAFHMGLRPGMALDLSTTDEEGVPWDFSRADRRAEARRRLNTESPWLLIGSPMCRMFSALQHLSKGKGNVQEKERLLLEGKVHLAFCCQLYLDQIARGKFFLHEHPAGATSWTEDCILTVARAPGVRRFIGHMCPHGMTASDEEGRAPVMKPTGWLTNSMYIGEAVSQKCPNLDKEWWEEKHRHVHLLSGRAKACEVSLKTVPRHPAGSHSRTRGERVKGYLRNWDSQSGGDSAQRRE